MAPIEPTTLPPTRIRARTTASRWPSKRKSKGGFLKFHPPKRGKYGTYMMKEAAGFRLEINIKIYLVKPDIIVCKTVYNDFHLRKYCYGNSVRQNILICYCYYILAGAIILLKEINKFENRNENEISTITCLPSHRVVSGDAAEDIMIA